MHSQPDCWERAVSLAPSYADRLPAAGERVAVLGCGTSLYVAAAYARARETSGLGPTDAWPASLARLDRGYDRVVTLTRSGTTTEVLDALRSLGDHRSGSPARPRVTVVTATADSPVLEFGDAILLEEFDERSVVQTRFATSVLTMLRAGLGTELRPVIDQARTILDASDDGLAVLRNAEQITFVGVGIGADLADEAALKLRESTRSWTESYPATEYRHGPISIAEPGRAVWSLGPLVPGFAADVAATGAHLETHDTDPQAELVRVHRVALLRAADRGIDPDHPRNLQRSVILGT